MTTYRSSDCDIFIISNISNIFNELFFKNVLVHHAEPSGLPLSLHPGSPEVRGGGFLQDLHLPPGLSPGAEGPLLPPGTCWTPRGTW